MASQLIEVDLYNGKHHVVHNPFAKGSQPRYVVGTSKPVGVTSVLSQTLSKDLMQWAVDCCTDYLHDKLGDGITADHIDAAGQEYIRKRDFGSGTGTEAHALVEKYLKGEPVSLVTTTKEAKNAYQVFVRWFEASQPKVINVEAVIYSEAFEYAGTYDCMLEINGKNVLCDLKTTNASRYAPKGVYQDNFLQLGAYAAAHLEQREYELANGGSKLCSIEDLAVISARKDGALDVVFASDLGVSLDECINHWYEVVRVHKFRKNLTKKLGGR